MVGWQGVGRSPREGGGRVERWCWGWWNGWWRWRWFGGALPAGVGVVGGVVVAVVGVVVVEVLGVVVVGKRQFKNGPPPFQ